MDLSKFILSIHRRNVGKIILDISFSSITIINIINDHDRWTWWIAQFLRSRRRWTILKIVLSLLSYFYYYIWSLKVHNFFYYKIIFYIKFINYPTMMVTTQAHINIFSHLQPFISLSSRLSSIVQHILTSRPPA